MPCVNASGCGEPCEHCGAHLFARESRGICCKHGKFVLPRLPDLPPPLQRLYTSSDPKASTEVSQRKSCMQLPCKLRVHECGRWGAEKDAWRSSIIRAREVSGGHHHRRNVVLFRDSAQNHNWYRMFSFLCLCFLIPNYCILQDIPLGEEGLSL